ncbi:nucleolin-like [Dysidea avara]|uniref:nucleolin-like n=1 Tax=Dysidea avara TaxID=196820 RepID=UPI003331E799
MMMLNSIKLITRAVVFNRTAPLLSRQLKYVPFRGFSEANNPRSDTIFVGQIPFDINEEELKLYFPGCLSVRIKRDKYRGYSKGFGYVTFKNHEEAKEAASKRVEIFGRLLNLDMAEREARRHVHERESSVDASSLTLFVGHLPLNMTESELMSLFPGCVGARIISDTFTGISKGYGYVDFHSTEEAKEYLKMNGMEFRGQYLNIDLASNKHQSSVRRGKSEASSTLFVGNLSYKTTESVLAATFSGCSKARIITDRDGKSRGFGYVDYLSVDQAKHVFHNRGNIEMDGRIVFVDFATNNINKIRNRDGPVRLDYSQRYKPNSTLYVGNLSYNTTVSDLIAAFSGCTSAKIVTYSDTGRSKGFGFVAYSTVEEAKQVVDSSDEIELDGHILHIDFSRRDSNSKRGTHEPTSMLFVGNLPLTVTESTLAAAFSGCTAVRIITDKRSGRSKGCGFVNYPSVEEAKRVFDNPDDFTIDGNNLFINFADTANVFEENQGTPLDNNREGVQQQPLDSKDDDVNDEK